MPTDLFLVDSSAWIPYLRRRRIEAIRQRIGELLASDQVATTGTILLEILGGTLDEAEWERLERLLGGLELLSTTEDQWTEAARLVWRLRRRGVTVPSTDGLIASVALRYGATVLHADAHFDRIAEHEGVKVESYVREVSGLA